MLSTLALVRTEGLCVAPTTISKSIPPHPDRRILLSPAARRGLHPGAGRAWLPARPAQPEIRSCRADPQRGRGPEHPLLQSISAVFPGVPPRRAWRLDVAVPQLATTAQQLRDAATTNLRELADGIWKLRHVSGSGQPCDQSDRGRLHGRVQGLSGHAKQQHGPGKPAVRSLQRRAPALSVGEGVNSWGMRGINVEDPTWQPHWP